MRGFGRVRKAVVHLARATCASRQGLKIRIFNEWQPALDQILEKLPETDVLPHELFRLLMKMSYPGRKEIVLITEAGQPVALAGLRKRWGYWEPVTQWIVPGVLFPVKEGYLKRVLLALGVNLQVAWWRMAVPPPDTQWVRQIVAEPTFSMPCSDDFESFWRKSSLFKNIRKARNRCKRFELRVNSPNSVDWIIRNWEKKWRPKGLAQMPDLEERLLAAYYLEKRHRYYAMILFEREKPLAGGTFVVHQNDLVAHCSFRNSDYDWHGVMNRVTDLSFHWAKERGFRNIDLGGTFDYKQSWAPSTGQKLKFKVCPQHLIVKERVAQFVGKTGRLLKLNLDFGDYKNDRP